MRTTNHFILDFENNFSGNYWLNFYPFYRNFNLNLNHTHKKNIKKSFYIIKSSSVGLSKASKNSETTKFNFSTQNLINLNFLRKERLYTKLKYSRSPAYDIVSGGTAAILAGFLGFLVSEKFGFELADSGDFYYLLMYAVFFSFSLRPLLITTNNNQGFKSIFSLYNIFSYFFFLVSQFINLVILRK